MEYTDNIMTFPDYNIFLSRIRDKEVQRTQNTNKLILDQLNVISTALYNAVKDPNMTEVELTFSQVIHKDVLNTITKNGYNYKMNYINNNGIQNCKLKIFPSI